MDSLSSIVNIWVGIMKYTHLQSSGSGGGAAKVQEMSITQLFLRWMDIIDV